MPLRTATLTATALSALLALLLAGTAWAQSGLVQGSGDALAATDPSLWSQFVAWAYTQQRIFHQELIEGLRALTNDSGAAAAWTLISASFLYGVFHAAGPGHGKAVLTTYLVTHREQMRRGVLLAVLAAFCQGLVAVTLVYGLIFLAGWLPKETKGAVEWSERASFALLMAMGGYLAYRAVRSALRRRRGRQAGCCGHAHAPSSEQVAAAGNIKATLGVVLSIGLRPCTGAVLVLVFAQISGLVWAGVGAVAAMSLGTALAVSVMAFVAINARSLAGRLAGQHGGEGWLLSADVVALAGGTVLALIGYSLLQASFLPRHPLGL